jgi:hypothetical protein
VVVMNVAIFWDIAPRSPYVNRRYEGTYYLHPQCRKVSSFLRAVAISVTGYSNSLLTDIPVRLAALLSSDVD